MCDDDVHNCILCNPPAPPKNFLELAIAAIKGEIPDKSIDEHFKRLIKETVAELNEPKKGQGDDK